MSGTEEDKGGGFVRGFIYGLILAVIGFVAYALMTPQGPDRAGISETMPVEHSDITTEKQVPVVEPEEPPETSEPASDEALPDQETPPEDANSSEENSPDEASSGEADQQIDASTPAGPQFGAPSVDEGSGLSIGSDAPPTLGSPESQVAIASPSSPDAPNVGSDVPVAPSVTDNLNSTGSDDADSPSQTTTALTPGNAMQDNSVPVSGSDDRPYFAIILEDVGDQGVPREGLTALKAAISFGVPVDDPQASQIAQLYQDAGFEVVALLPDTGLTAAEVTTDLAVFFEAVPNAAAVLDRETSALLEDATLGQAVLTGLKITGHGMLAYGSEDSALQGLAVETGVPSAQVFRVIDERPEPENITLALERAVTEAKETGAVIVTGHTNSDTITTLFAWLLGPGSSSVKIVPASAAIKRLSE